jgi:hypothetical protein
MNNLMYSPEDQVVTREELAQAGHGVVMGSRHQPVSFLDYANEVARGLTMEGYGIMSEEYVLTKDKQTFFGAMQISTLEWQEHDFRVALGLRGSHVQKISRGICIGESIIVCSNLCFDGDLGNWKTKQTTNGVSRMRGMINEAVALLPDRVDARADTFEKMKEVKVTQRWGDAKLVDLFRAGGLSADQLPRAVKEWADPSFDHGSELTLWRLFNAATQALKPTGVAVNMQLIADRSTIVSRELSEVVA